jgi:cytochrome c oxidase assembly protein subunit 15
LTVHLNIALLLYAWLIWVALGEKEQISNKAISKLLRWIIVVFAMQLILGGLMSGMKACLYYPTWPDMHGEVFPKALMDSSLWNITSIIEYEKGLIPGLVQFAHRTIAYLLSILIAILYWKSRKLKVINIPSQLLLALLILQVCLGVLTLVNCVGNIPFYYGVLHQAVAILILSVLVYLLRKIRS